MSLVNLVKVTTATTGTGTVTLSAAVAGFLTMSQANAVDGATYSYGISEGTNSEVGIGIWTSATNTLTRTVVNSTNSNTVITLAGAAKVIITALAADHYIAPYTVVTKSATYTETATFGELIILANLTAGFTITMPTAIGNTAEITVKKILSAGQIVINCFGSQAIDNGLTATLTRQYETITMVSDNANWWLI